MKTPLNILISAIDRFYNDGIITKEEYETIILSIIADRIKEKEGANDG